MLSVSLIRLNHNPFSSSILLVKKKDDNWHFCVDYKALDAITIKDCFPMSMMDELLEKLGTTSWFLKLDLLQGFHQILMAEYNTANTTFRTH